MTTDRIPMPFKDLAEAMRQGWQVFTRESDGYMLRQNVQGEWVYGFYRPTVLDIHAERTDGAVADPDEVC